MNPVLSIHGLHVAHGARQVLRGVDLTVAPGEIVALMGVSGAGKSTVLRCVAALQAFDAGSVQAGGFALRPGPVPRERSLRELRGRVGMVFQAHSLFEHLTALQNVTLAPLHALRWAPARAEAVAMELLGMLGVAGRAGAYPRQLSGGEAQRVAIARALAPDPALLLMDEPTSALDPARRGALGDALSALAAQGRGLLIFTHDTDFAREHAHRVAVLSEGVMVESGAAAEILTRPAHPATRELLRGSAPD
ncbi:amino acid ABC transporter ATP-binding protein [Longimicrobium terrae]|uniref:ABC-type polar amino acid transport system ATPase subunit n=1 Tax=Longimicrobium terrae TaxID=1639882 RepID=A0A841GLB1_9BACT|nr:ATP-binding cassette domain-containing protein [Longimicrobium terrae]MBB4634993.1 ABC-type polar amino acid transport system ATPase subunit [Longimicrobium terrae]MBB6069387.1 ABC-type polar amino acid transport system ATPase subunit [Longimicrobium terrae]NNC31807.1 amino acid ABC transporter ATP-binding protein [Longimicrobium terrae]